MVFSSADYFTNVDFKKVLENLKSLRTREPNVSKIVKSKCDNELEDEYNGNSSMFVIDTKGVNDERLLDSLEEKEKTLESIDSTDTNEEKEASKDENTIVYTPPTHCKKKFSSLLDPGINIHDTYLNVNPVQSSQKPDAVPNLNLVKFDSIKEIMKKSAIKAGLEKLDSLPSSRNNQKLLKKQKRAEKDATKGEKWFNMPAPEITDELKNDLAVLRMRSALDPKRFYKKNDLKTLPKYFQVGTVVDNPEDFYHSRIIKKERKKTVVEELIEDSEFRKFNKRKYAEIQEKYRNVRRHDKRKNFKKDKNKSKNNKKLKAQ